MPAKVLMLGFAVVLVWWRTLTLLVYGVQSLPLGAPLVLEVIFRLEERDADILPGAT